MDFLKTAKKKKTEKMLSLSLKNEEMPQTVFLQGTWRELGPEFGLHLYCPDKKRHLLTPFL